MNTSTQSMGRESRPEGAMSQCGYCEGSDTIPLYSTRTTEGEPFVFVRCQSCEAVSLSPRPTARRLAAAYSEAYYGPGDTKFVAPIEAVIDSFRNRRARRIAKMLPQGGAVLDIGCGNGQFLRYLADRGFDAHGTERPGRAAERARAIDGLQLHVGESGAFGFPNESFDVITMWHVIEHLTEPRLTLENAYRWLKPGGRMVVSLPNVDSWQCRLFKGNWLHHDPPRHLFYLGPAPLRRNLTAMGFRCVRSSFFSVEQNVFGIQQSLLNCLMTRRDVLFDSLRGSPPPGVGRAGILLQTLFFVATFPLGLILASVEAIGRRGGTMEFVFMKPAGGGV